MRRVLAIAVVIVSLGFSQAGGTKADLEKHVTVTGCIYQGVECLVLKNRKGKQDYSVVRGNNLQIGHAYRITGSMSDVGICQEGKPILSAQMVHELRLQCAPSMEKK